MLNIFNNLKKTLFTLFNEPRHFKGDQEKFERLFQQTKDPWNFTNSVFEKKRFGIMLKFINLIKPQSILELGCAEGHFTKYLVSVSADITAVEISKTAIKRASQNVSGVKFLLGDFTKMNFNRKFSLILATEVFCYPLPEDLERFIKNCQTDYLLTSSFWNCFKKKEIIIKRYGFKKNKSKWVFRFELGFPKIAYICLWKKYLF